MTTTAGEHLPARTTPDRLTPDDDLFIRMEHALGLPVNNQCLWRLPGRVPAEQLADLAARMRRGRMSRLVRRRRLGRDRWVYTPNAGRYRLCAEPIAPGDETHWARQCGDEPLDTTHGPAWRLTAAYSADGASTYVSLLATHAIADGGAATAAILEAIHGIDYDDANVRLTAAGELRDSADLLLAAGRVAGGMLLDAVRPTRTDTDTAPQIPGPSNPAPAPAPRATPAPDGPGISPTAIMTIPAEDFRVAAKAAGGTPNTLFVAIIIGVLERTGKVRAGEVIPLSLPVSTRVDGDRRANATTGVTATVVVDDERYHDLTPIRVACKEAFGRLADGPTPAARLGVLAQALGDGVVRRLAANASTPLCLASNMGQIHPDFASLGTGSPGPVVVRSVTRAPDVATLRRMAGGISGWATESAGVLTLSATSLDPDRVADDEALTALIRAELDRWGLAGRPWGA